MEHDATSGFLTGFIMGVIVGAAIGFLYAPHPGKETREIVKDQAGKIKSKTAAIAEEVKEKAHHLESSKASE
jgi:gas vesicle protein